MSYKPARTVITNTQCFECGDAVRYATTEEREFDVSQGDIVACVACARKLGDYTMWYCWHCGVQYQCMGRYNYDPESCSDECAYAIDESVERAVQMQYDYIERRLESM